LNAREIRRRTGQYLPQIIFLKKKVSARKDYEPENAWSGVDILVERPRTTVVFLKGLHQA